MHAVSYHYVTLSKVKGLKDSSPTVQNDSIILLDIMITTPTFSPKGLEFYEKISWYRAWLNPRKSCVD